MTLWAVPTAFGWVVKDDSAEGPEPDSYPDAVVTKKDFWYRVDGYGGAKVSKHTPLWYCWRCRGFDCDHTAAVVSEDRQRREIV